jgi:hypothetical protein
MKVSIDNGETWVEVNDTVKVIYNDLEIDDGPRACSIEAELHVTLTHEGVIQDVFPFVDDPFRESWGTSSEMAQEITDRLTGN